MNEEMPCHKKLCPAMSEAGIKDPDSTEGIVFCAGDRNTESKCPYPYCIAFEVKALTSAIKRQLARDLHNHGVSIKDIALILGSGY